MKKIGVLGGINTDFVFSANNFPKQGETIIGNLFTTNFGGKGANKAVAIARLSGNSCIFGGVGDDKFSADAISNFKKQGVDATYLKVCKNCSGGVAGIYTTNKTNEIVVIKGANQYVDTDYIDSVIETIKTCDAVVAELEIPVQTVEYLSKICKENGILFVLNPSPITKISDRLIRNCDYIVVNEVEINQLGNYKNFSDALIDFGGRLILTCGADGVYFFDGEIKHIPANKTKVVDTTGAGDTFLGAFLYKFDKTNFEEALNFANIVAGLKITKIGAQTGMPTLKEVEDFAKLHNIII